MKKFTSFLIAGLIVLIASASAQQGQVILNSNTNFEVQIDGRTYNSQGRSAINDLSPGNHAVAVYQVVSKGIFGIGKKRNQLSFEQFRLGNNDVNIDVSQNGQVRIYQEGYKDKNNTRNRNGDYNGNANTNNGKYGKSEGKGNGKKYGHYKNKKNKHSKGDRKRERDDDDDNRSDRRRDKD